MATPLRVLILEDQPADAELMVHELELAGFALDYRRVASERDYVVALGTTFDVILADYSLPSFNALAALEELKQRGLQIPFIVVTGALGDEAAVECVKQGAADYLLKDRLKRLGAAVTRALDAQRETIERERAEEALKQSRELAAETLRQANAMLERRIARSIRLRFSSPAARGSAMSRFPSTTESRLLKLCATPPPSRPIASSFCA